MWPTRVFFFLLLITWRVLCLAFQKYNFHLFTTRRMSKTLMHQNILVFVGKIDPICNLQPHTVSVSLSPLRTSLHVCVCSRNGLERPPACLPALARLMGRANGRAGGGWRRGGNEVTGGGAGRVRRSALSARLLSETSVH